MCPDVSPMLPAAPESLFFETVRVLDGCAERTALHQQRAERSICMPLPPIESLLTPEIIPQQGEYKVHMTYSRRGFGRVQVQPYVPRCIRTMRAIESSITYPYKSEDRSALDQLRSQHPDVDELIICHNGYVTDTTYSNLLFGEPGEWYTPSHYLLAGTRRQDLLEQGIIRTKPVRREHIPQYPYLCLINAMLPPERLMLPTTCVQLG